MCRESRELIRWGLLMVGFALIAIGCLEEAESPRPLPPLQPDAFDFDPREPIRMPGIGSGYGSGAVAPTGRSASTPSEESVDGSRVQGDANHSDAAIDGGVDAAFDEGVSDES